MEDKTKELENRSVTGECFFKDHDRAGSFMKSMTRLVKHSLYC